MILSSPTHPLIGIDPAIRFGRPCIAGTRISVRDVLGWLSHGMSVVEIIEDFPELTAEAVAAAQAYAADCVAPYSQLLGRGPDFRVTYRLLTAKEGGRNTPAYQHIPWDLRYEDKAVSTGTWMWVYPEFLDSDGRLVPNGPFSPVGRADMFIFNPAQRDFHRQHIRPGVRGYFMEGGHRVGVWEVAEVPGLKLLPSRQPNP